MGVWQLGNTTVRSALRIREGLVAYSRSSVQGEIRGREGDEVFRQILGDAGVVSLGDDKTVSVGRKWRSAMGKLGFIFPKVEKGSNLKQEDLGPLDVITPAGWALIRSTSVPAIQECYARAMSVPLHPADNSQVFSPLVWVLKLLLSLELKGEEPEISFQEMQYIVQLSTPSAGIDATVKRIRAFRQKRNSSESKRLFDRDLRRSAKKQTGYDGGTLRDYADENIRYLKATGLVCAKGKGIALVPEKHFVAIQMTGMLLVEADYERYVVEQCRGAALPTDDLTVALGVLRDLQEQARESGIVYSVDKSTLKSVADVNRMRYELEGLLFDQRELKYAADQANCWRDIAGYLDTLAGKRGKLADGSDARVDKVEGPAYFEWTLWRAFLALDSLVIPPNKVRRFKVDQDFLPVSTAPGNGPDLVAEFENCIIAVEATLSSNSRQEAMEGEPVRRHVAELQTNGGKVVYGLFVAGKVDTNTIETFRRGTWYDKNDELKELTIVPLSIEQFALFFRWAFCGQTDAPSALVALLNDCAHGRETLDAPGWRSHISKTVESSCSLLQD